jgi:hypothetical protein
MLKNWWIEYWWILASVIFFILLIMVSRVLTRHGTFESTWPRIGLAINCVVIMLIPTMHSPGSYVNAAIVVINLVMLFRFIFNRGMPSQPADRR